MYEDIICEQCKGNMWTHESVGKQKWLTCSCGNDQELPTIQSRTIFKDNPNLNEPVIEDNE